MVSVQNCSKCWLSQQWQALTAYLRKIGQTGMLHLTTRGSIRTCALILRVLMFLNMFFWVKMFKHFEQTQCLHLLRPLRHLKICSFKMPVSSSPVMRHHIPDKKKSYILTFFETCHRHNCLHLSLFLSNSASKNVDDIWHVLTNKRIHTVQWIVCDTRKDYEMFKDS
jgi:hypothetical protein